MNSTLADIVHVIESAACGKNYLLEFACSSQKPLLLKYSSFQGVTQTIRSQWHTWQKTLPESCCYIFNDKI